MQYINSNKINFFFNFEKFRMYELESLNNNFFQKGFNYEQNHESFNFQYSNHINEKPRNDEILFFLSNENGFNNYYYPDDTLMNNSINEGINNNTIDNFYQSDFFQVNQYNHNYIDLNEGKEEVEFKNITNNMDKKIDIKTRKLDEDSINKKIKNSYFNLIIKLLNHLLEIKQRKDLSFRVLYNNKKKASKKYMEDIQNKKIKDIIIKENKHNLDIDNKIQKDEKLKIISNVLEQDFLYFFDKIYCKKRKTKYNLNEFGLGDFEFDLPENIQLYEDLLEKNKDEDNFMTYKTRINICINNYFMPNKKHPIFKCRKTRRTK